MIKINPVGAQHVAVKVNGDLLGDFDHQDVIGIMNTLHAEYPGQTTLNVESGGFPNYKATSDVVNKALELAGLSGLDAAKEQAIRKIKF